MRQPDKPGAYRIRRKVDGSWWLGGLQTNGKRVRMSLGSEGEAKRTADVLFPRTAPSPAPPLRQFVPAGGLDDWGLPLSVGPDVAATVNDTLGVKPAPLLPPPPATPVFDAGSLPTPDPIDDKAKAESRERAKTLCELLGVGWAMADVAVAKRMTEWMGKEPINPSVSQVNSLAKAAKTAFVDLLGDMEVGKWTMLFLLSAALPASMLIQAKPRALQPKTKDRSQETSEPIAAPHLKTV